MAMVDIKMVNVSSVALSGGGIPVARSVPVAESQVTSSATSQVVTLASVERYGVWAITAIGGGVRVKFGAAPVANATSGWYIADGDTLTVGVSSTGEKVAVIDA